MTTRYISNDSYNVSSVQESQSVEFQTVKKALTEIGALAEFEPNWQQILVPPHGFVLSSVCLNPLEYQKIKRNRLEILRIVREALR